MYQKLISEDNMNIPKWVKPETVDLVYADMIFDNYSFGWIDLCYEVLKPTGSLWIHTDQRSVAEVRLYVDTIFAGSGYLNNWIIWPYDWGGRPKNAFGRKHDDLLWYVKSPDFKFYPKRVAIPKVTAGSPGLNPSGRTWKVPTDVWSDIGNFLTTSPERVKDENGVCIPWQKPERLLDRIVKATTDKEDLVLDPFLGTGTLAVVCKKLGRSIIAFEIDPVMIDVAVGRIQQTTGGGYKPREEEKVVVREVRTTRKRSTISIPKHILKPKRLLKRRVIK